MHTVIYYYNSIHIQYNTITKLDYCSSGCAWASGQTHPRCGFRNIKFNIVCHGHCFRVPSRYPLNAVMFFIKFFSASGFYATWISRWITHELINSWSFCKTFIILLILFTFSIQASRSVFMCKVYESQHPGYNELIIIIRNIYHTNYNIWVYVHSSSRYSSLAKNIHLRYT